MQRRRPLGSMRRRLAGSAGFTLVEMVIAVAVMAILAGVTAPPLYQFMRQRDGKLEQLAQLEIQQALRAYEQQNLAFPSDTITTLDPANAAYANNWFMQLAPYTKLAVHDLLFDTWGNERRYVATTVNTTFNGISIPLSYASLLSAGPDGKVSAACFPNGSGKFTDTANGSINGFAPAGATQWWKSQSNPVAAFAALTCKGGGQDEILLKTTDVADKVNRYAITVRHLNEVSAALETYSKSRQSEAQAAYAGNPASVVNYPGTPTPPANMLYYPVGWTDAEAASNEDPLSNYDQPVVVATAAVRNNTNNILANTTNNTIRYESMVTLMRQLGLPDTDCCSALAQFTDATGTYPLPFYYASNPRPVTSVGACGPRPNPAAGGVALPARVSTVPPTDPSACY